MVDKFWPMLERDFAKIYQIRAMEWFEKKRDWRELYRLRQGLGVGTEWHTAMANDPDVALEIARHQRDHPPKSSKPSPVGFDPIMHKLTDLDDRLQIVAASFGGGNFTPAPRPEYESDRAARYLSKKNSRRIQAMLVPHDNIEELPELTSDMLSHID